MRIRIRIPQVLVVVGVLALGSVGLAAIAQYQFDMQPCPWCVLQRLIYIVVGVLALLGALLSNTPRRVAVGLAFLGALSGVAAALYQQLHAVNEASCDLSMAERFISWLQLDRLVPQLFIAYASCADADPAHARATSETPTPTARRITTPFRVRMPNGSMNYRNCKTNAPTEDLLCNT